MSPATRAALIGLLRSALLLLHEDIPKPAAEEPEWVPRWLGDEPPNGDGDAKQTADVER
jgi:hypothetical protein